jgi:nucleotide-binding universal stress UspA family protein
MYKNVLVPLDGSELAECVLPHVKTLAAGCGVASVVFLRVVEPVRVRLGGKEDGGFTEEDADKLSEQAEQSENRSAEDYLNRILLQNKYEGVLTRAEVLRGKPAESIADYARKNEADLVLISTHGRSGISRWVWGSVADRVLRSSCVPVTMVRAPGCPSA